ncbi:MAG: DUF971 domain-containing protein [Cellvibrionales bacterium]|nr:DUF971 domain-containing protein [Cellvibrionales bacterium]
MSATARPQRIRLRQQGRVLELHHESEVQTLEAEYLRVSSPSAEMRGHGADGSGAVLPVGKKHVRIAKLEPAGHYALRLYFSDGHDSGLYTWAYLHRLGAEKPHRWQQYLAKLQAAGAARDPEVQAVRLLDLGDVDLKGP